MSDCDSICLKLLLCSNSAATVARQSMKLAPKDGEIQASGEEIFGVFATARDFELRESFTRAEKLLIIAQANKVEALGPQVKEMLENGHSDKHALDAIYDVYEDVAAAVNQLLTNKTTGWDQ